jgi:hypothetical protein
MPDSQLPKGTRSRLAVVAASAVSLELSCAHIIGLALGRGNAVLCAAPDLQFAMAANGPLTGAASVNLLDDPGSLASSSIPARSKRLQATFADWRPDTVLAVGLDVLPLAQHAARTIRLNNIACLLFENPSHISPGVVRRWLTKRSQRAALKKCGSVIVAHDSQAQTCARQSLPLPARRTVTISGPGADLATIDATPLPPISDGMTILAITDPWDSRTRAAIAETANQLRAAHQPVTIRSVVLRSEHVDIQPGEVPDDCEPLTPAQFNAALHACHFLIQLGSRYPHPPGLLAGLAAARPILALDRISYRSMVDERVNGILIPSSQPAEIISGIKNMLSRPDLLPSMARASRAKAERRFDARICSKHVMDSLGLR